MLVTNKFFWKFCILEYLLSFQNQNLANETAAHSCDMSACLKWFLRGLTFEMIQIKGFDEVTDSTSVPELNVII